MEGKGWGWRETTGRAGLMSMIYGLGGDLVLFVVDELLGLDVLAGRGTLSGLHGFGESSRLDIPVL